MTKKTVLIVSATKEKNTKNTLLSQSLTTMSQNSSVFKNQYKINYHTNNTQALPRVYNQYITAKILKQHDIVLFVHDDVYIDDLGCFDKLRTSIFEYGNDIVGLAGSTRATIKEPTLWHQMSDRRYHSGAVAHINRKTDMLQTTSFGPYPKRCLLLDGLFVAINLEKILNTKWKFNENFEFHHYDLSSCLDANKLKLKMSTCNVHVVHGSPGLADYYDKSFQQSQKKFLQLYGDNS